VLLAPERCYAAGAVHEGWAFRLEDGRITAVGPPAALPSRPAGGIDAPEPIVPLPGRLLLPDGVNAHNHSFQSLLRGLGDDLNFMGWRDRVLYPFSRRLDARGIEIVTHLDGTAFSAEEAFRLGTAGGAEVLGLPIGEIAAGRLGDLVALDLGHPSLHPPNALIKSVVYALSPQAITDVWVHGRRVVQDGRVTTLDEAGLLGEVRALTRDWRI